MRSGTLPVRTCTHVPPHRSHPAKEPPISAVPPPTDLYATRRDDFAAQRDRVHRQWSLIANLRLIGFVAIALLLWRWLFVTADALTTVGLMAALILVIALVVTHGRLRRERDRLARLVTVNERAIARATLAWDALPLPPSSEIARDHAYAYDLNVLGRASLEQRIGTPATRRGWATLRAWLLAPTSPTEIAARQEAVAELGGQIDRRQQVESASIGTDDELADPAALIAWASGTTWLRERPWLTIIAWISPIAFVLAIIAQVSGLTPYPLWLAPIVVNVLVSQLVGARASTLVAEVTPLHQTIAGYQTIFAAIATDPGASSRLRTIAQTLGDGPDGAMTQIARLTRASTLAVPRGAMLYFPFQLAFLWDLHVLAALERWQVRAGSQIEAWIDAAAEWEALAALAVLRHDHPDWTFPDVDLAHDRLAAEGIRHPLIVPSEAVANPVTVGPRGTLLLVTGSNMSGKSTLLRAVGANAVLAQAGGPVAADALRMPIVDVWTCMRVEDSLARGVSFFMAELLRLKAVVDAAMQATDRPVLYLLDEILQGTNTVERQIASRQVLRQLTRAQAIGAVSSHDLGLLESTDLDTAAEKVHFAETFTRDANGPSMTFDYALRPGLATSTNALKLMEVLGFTLEDA